MTDIIDPGEVVTVTKKLGRRQKRRKGMSRTQQYKAKQPQPRPDYQPIVKENENFVKYYKLQSIIQDEDFDVFMEGLRATLPASFRINTFDLGQAKFLKRLVQGPQLNEYLNVQETNTDSTETPTSQDTKLTALEPLDWYPSKFGWQMNITRVDLKKSPLLQQFHKFIMAETDNGFISRQESVSMIPPLLLDVKRGQCILDMCAAPGSKTAQLLEYLKCDISNETTYEVAQTDHLFDDGLVVANDVDNKRCYMLVHQSSRLNSPNCVIINEDASKFPNMKTFEKSDQECVRLKFDRILCDVPCSGDGTMRKNPDVWKKWTVANANNFHGMQVKIIRRGVELLKKDGLLVYSTCSMNPVEDEAVVASILRASEGQIVLEKITNKLPGLKFRAGLSEWTVMNREMIVMPNLDQVPHESSTQIYPSLFPPNEDERKQFNLDRCARILPHLQNTGGFFVALLKKKVDRLPWETSAPEKDETSNKKTIQPPNPKKRRFNGFKEDPFIFMTDQDPDWLSIKSVYGLSDTFPVEQLVHRCQSGKKRVIYLVSKMTRNFMIANREESDKKTFVKIINGGMRLFNRATTEAGFRICQDGVNEILPYVKDDIKVPMIKSDLIALLKSRTVGVDLISSSNQIRDKIKQGSFIFVYEHKQKGEEEDITFKLPLVAWRGEYTVALYVSKTYRKHLCAIVELKMDEDAAEKDDKADNNNE